MKDDQKKALDEALKKLDNMTPEEWEKEIWQLNGRMNVDLFNKVILKIIDEANSEDLLYYEEKFPFTQEEFHDVFNYIKTFAGNRKIDCSDYFPEQRAYFTYENMNFIWRLVVGQGSFCQIYKDEKEFDENKSHSFYMDINPSLKFYKVIK